MPKSYKLIIAITSSLLIITAMYLGSYLPLKKSQFYIKAMVSFKRGEIRSLQEFNNSFNPVLDFYSPVGQDEIVSYYLGILINIINQQTDREIIDILIKQAEERMAPILKTKRGFAFNQNLFTFGSIYKVAAIKLNDEIYYQKGVDIFKEGLKYSPDRPIFLYGLFSLYLARGDRENIKKTGEVILRYWPGDEEVRKIIFNL